MRKTPEGAQRTHEGELLLFCLFQGRRRAGGGLTQVPVGDGVVVVVVVHLVVLLLLLDAVALVLLGDRARAMETRPDVLLVVGNGLVLLDVALAGVNERESVSHYNSCISFK